MRKKGRFPCIRHKFRAENNDIEIFNLAEITGTAMEGTIKSVILKATKTGPRKEARYEKGHPYMCFVRLFSNNRGMGR